MSDKRPYGDDPSRYSYPHQSVTPSHPFFDVVDPYRSTSSDVDSVDSADRNVRNFSMTRCSKKKKKKGPQSVAVWQNVDPYGSTSSDVDSADRNVRSFALKKCSTKKKMGENKEYQQWIDTWKKGNEPPPEIYPGGFLMDYYVCTDGYFRAGRKGGYGVIVRDNVGNPIVASAVTSREPVSFLYHQVEAVTGAVELAVKFSLGYIQLFCNAKHVARLVNRVFKTVFGCDLHSSHQENSVDVICRMCVKGCLESFTEEDYHLVFPLLKRIGELVRKFHMPLDMLKVSRERNKAADYLAKNGAPGMKVLHPCQFPDELKEILCKDYVGSHMYGLPVLM